MGFYDLRATSIDGDEVRFDDYKGKVVLVVNTASKCGLTPQYKGLEALHEKYEDKGLVILGFPCDQFANQEPGDADAIKGFCELNYGVTFPLFEKIDVNGPNTHPVFQYLKDQKGGLLSSKIKWNFTKFLVDKEGNVVKRFAPTKEPASIEADIIKYLEQ